MTDDVSEVLEEEFINFPHHCSHEAVNAEFYRLWQIALQHLKQVQDENQILKANDEVLTTIGSRKKTRSKQDDAQRKRICVNPTTIARLETIFSSLIDLKSIHALLEIDNVFPLLSNSKFLKLYRIAGLLKPLIELVGLKKQKEKIFNLFCYFMEARESNDLNHIFIHGPAGSGKTRLAIHLANILLQLKMFEKKGELVIVRRSEIVGADYSAKITQSYIDKAIGGILLIDCVWDKDDETADMYSSECLETLMLNLRNKRGEFVCILTGLSEELTIFGNRSIDHLFMKAMRINITPYSSKELCQMFSLRAQAENWKLELDLDNLQHVFSKYHSSFHRFGWDVEALWIRAKMSSARRSILTVLGEDSLQIGDVESACTECFEEKVPSTLYV